MELDITHFFNNEDAGRYSASVAELGSDACRITWGNAVRQARDEPLLKTPQAIDYARDYFGGFGAWDDEERAAWTDDEVNALVIQEISASIREIESLCMDDDGEIDWDLVERYSNEGRINGCIFRCDSEDMRDDFGRIFFYLGD